MRQHGPQEHIAPHQPLLVQTGQHYHVVSLKAGLAKSLARRPGAIVFSSRATKMYHCPARRATLNTGQGVFKALKSFKYVKWYKKSLNCNFKRSYSWDGKARITTSRL